MLSHAMCLVNQKRCRFEPPSMNGLLVFFLPPTLNKMQRVNQILKKKKKKPIGQKRKK